MVLLAQMLQRVTLLLLEMRQRYVTSCSAEKVSSKKGQYLSVSRWTLEPSCFNGYRCWGRLMFQICSTQLRWGTNNSSPLWNKGSSEQSLKSSMLCWGAPAATDLWPPACVFLRIKGRSRRGSNLHTELQIHQRGGGGAAEQSSLDSRFCLKNGLPGAWVFVESQANWRI